MIPAAITGAGLFSHTANTAPTANAIRNTATPIPLGACARVTRERLDLDVIQSITLML